MNDIGALGRDMVANLLAEENLTVVRKNVSTASFDIKNRVLTLPNWEHMSPSMEDMLVAHEVGHALFTDSLELLERAHAHKNPQVFPTYLNIVEDIRIERMMKIRFPGIKKCFYQGYSSAMAADMFKIADAIKDNRVKAYSLVDRLNLYFKIGSFTKVRFSVEEKPFVERAKTIETMADAYQLALDLYELAALTEKPKTSDQSNVQYTQVEGEDLDEDSEGSYQFNESDEDSDSDESDSDESDEDSDSDESDEDSDSDESDEDSDSDESNKSDGVKSSESDEEVDVEAPLTGESFDESVNKFARIGGRDFGYYKLINNITNNIVDYKEINKDFSAMLGSGFVEHQKPAFDKFMVDSKKAVAYMVKEFEMRKAATNYARTRVAKSGVLNMNKVYAYKLNDDLFKQITRVANGKNHGMIMLVDWSSSMANVIDDVIKQVINLAMFCRRIDIPFEVYAFANQGAYNIKPLARSYPHSDHGSVLYNHRYSLLNLFSSKMNQREFTNVCKTLVMLRPWMRNRRYELYNTPLNSALLGMIDIIPQFIRENAVEKMSLIVLTDGESYQLSANCPVDRYTTNYIVDPVTKKNHVTGYIPEETAALLEIIKNRYGVKVLGFDLFSGGPASARTVIYRNFARHPTLEETDKFASDIRREGFSLLHGRGRDALFAVRAKSMRIEDAEISIDKGASVASIAKSFREAMASGKTSRLLLNKFIEFMA